MNAVKRWFSAARRAPGEALAPAPDDILNAGTWASVADLVAMQRHAAKIRMSFSGPARARLAGDHLSRFRGRGMDYQESRGYQPGDDIRSMDWRVTARTGNAHVKVYQEERERPIFLFVDLNPGMFFGTRGMLKSVLAARLAALIAWAALDHGDRVGAMLFNGGHCDLPPRGGKHGVLQLIRQLVAHTDPRLGLEAPARASGLNDALGRLRRVTRPGSLVVLISDFYGLDDDSNSQLARLRQHNDVMAVQVVDAIEEGPPAGGLYGIESAGRSGFLDTRSAASRRAYQDYFGQHHQQVADTMRRSAISLLRVSADSDAVAALSRHFATGLASVPMEPPTGRPEDDISRLAA